METIGISELRKNLKTTLQNITDNSENLRIYRPKGEDLVIMPLSEYNAIMETEYLLSTQANKATLDKSIQQAKEGQLTTLKTEDLWK